VRGTLDDAKRLSEENRFIPAGAGNAGDETGKGGRRTVHPRGCGERVEILLRKSVPDGSSPRVRGTHRRECARHGVYRFIPAGAGNAVRAGARPARRPVHPRGCGERRHDRRRRLTAGGSSPRVRGTRPTGRRRIDRSRFIPAGAGNARPGPRVRRLHPVHPRGCGERPSSLGGVTECHGSSPRVRGTRRCRRLGAAGKRFIPAGAGNA